MTCGEFQHTAETFSLRELAVSANPALVAHAGACSRCGSWLQEKRTLADAMVTLQQRTADLSASPQVERSLLRAFREGIPESVEVPAAHRFTPLAFRLSRIFEVGAYVAVAAAIVLGVFLGIRLVGRHGQKPALARNTAQAVAGSGQGAAHLTVVSPAADESGKPARERRSSRIASVKNVGAVQVAAEDEYVPLMFCDPLSCSEDAEVVRMEIPAQGADDGQPQVADVVVGNDGVVRAVRIVN